MAADDHSPPAVGGSAAPDLSSPPERVISLVPSVTESLFDLGLGDCLVGVTDFCVHPADRVAHLPRIGGTKNPDLRLIRAAAPDLIIANQEENRRADIEALRGDGFEVWVTFPRTVRESIDVLWDLIRLFRAPQMGQTLSVLETSFEWASLAAASATPVRVFCPIWREPDADEGPPRWWMTFNHDTYPHDLLRVCGAENVFGDRERAYPLAADVGDAQPASRGSERDVRYPRIAPHEIAERAPELILLPSEPYAFSAADIPALTESAEIPAVANHRITFVDGSLLTWHGTRLARALMELPALVRGEAHAAEPPRA